MNTYVVYICHTANSVNLVKVIFSKRLYSIGTSYTCTYICTYIYTMYIRMYIQHYVIHIMYILCYTYICIYNTMLYIVLCM